jgi:hypothetical protein
MRNFEDVQRDYHFSYSGADCRVYASEEDGNVSLLRSLATASISVHEAKAPVRTLGKRGVVGFTESIRTIAGSLVFIVVNDHPLGHLKDHGKVNNNFSLDMPKGQLRKLSTMLNPIDLYFVYKTEISKQNEQGEMWVKGLRFINEGIVTSVNDMVTEVVMQFVAEDVVPFSNETKSEVVQKDAFYEWQKEVATENAEKNFLSELSTRKGEVKLPHASRIVENAKAQRQIDILKGSKQETRAEMFERLADEQERKPSLAESLEAALDNLQIQR